MNEIKTDLQLTTAQKNKHKLTCVGCKEITKELFSLKVDKKIIFMCGDCKEALTAHFDNEDMNLSISLKGNKINKYFNVRKNGMSGDSDSDCGYYDVARYTNDHTDC